MLGVVPLLALLLFSAFYLVAAGKGGKVVLCYITSWGIQRTDPQSRFAPDDVQPQLCTHLMYISAGIDANSSSIVSLQPQLDEPSKKGKGIYNEIISLKKRHPHLKVLLSTGHRNFWAREARKFSDLAASPILRRLFRASVITFLRKHQFDGLDINWYTPTETDRENLVVLLKELREDLDLFGLILTIFLVSDEAAISRVYDLPGIGRHVHLAAVSSYNYLGPWNKQVGPFSALRSKRNPRASVEFTLNEMLRRGMPASKLVMGLGSFGHMYMLREKREPTEVMGAEAEAADFQGLIGFKGVVGYNEVCQMLAGTMPYWQQYWDYDSSTPYAVLGQYVMSYENGQSFELKVNMMLEKNLAGLMLWKSDTDDFKGWCGGNKNPLLKLMNNALKNGKPDINNKVPSQLSHKKVLFCYVSSWSMRWKGEAKFRVEDINPNLCTHLVYTSSALSEDNTLTSLDPELDLDGTKRQGVFKRMTALKAKYPHIKVILSMTGNGNEGLKLSAMILSSAERRKFVASALDLVRKHNFDGLEINIRDTRSNDKENLVLLMKELKQKFYSHKLLLVSILSGQKNDIDNNYNLPSLSKYLDYVLVNTFGFHGPWDGKFQPLSPLTTTPNYMEESFEYILDYYLSHGVDRSKLVMGVAGYGFTYILLGDAGLSYNMGEPTEPHGFEGPLIKNPFFIGYNEVCRLLKSDQGWNEAWDIESSTPFAYNGKKVIAYDNELSLNLKVQMIQQKNIAGVMVWKIDTDDSRGFCTKTKFPLLSSVYKAIMS